VNNVQFNIFCFSAADTPDKSLFIRLTSQSSNFVEIVFRTKTLYPGQRTNAINPEEMQPLPCDEFTETRWYKAYIGTCNAVNLGFECF